MRVFLSMIVSLSMLIVITNSAAEADPLPSTYSAHVLDVIDGDTIRVSVQIWVDQTIVTLVRVKGVDTPELRSSCADERRKSRLAKQRLTDLINGQDVFLHDAEYGKYAGRILGRVTLADGKDVSDMLIEENLARYYDGGTRQSWC